MNFSILMSLYHKEQLEYLEECLVSIWDQQTLKPDEIILVLDGPVGEGLMQSVKKWQAKLENILRVIDLPENLGLGKALNEGLKYCTNEWIFRMDTDDICMPDRFEKQIQFIQSNPEVVLFGGQVIEFNENIYDADRKKIVPLSYSEIVNFCKLRSPFNHVSVAFKKSIVEKVGGYQHHLSMEDYNLWLRIISKGYNVANLPDTLLYVRVGNGMYTKRKGLEYIKSEIQLLNLKKNLKTQSSFSAIASFILRSLFRFLPSTVLKKFYNTFLRKKISE